MCENYSRCRKGNDDKGKGIGRHEEAHREWNKINDEQANKEEEEGSVKENIRQISVMNVNNCNGRKK